MDELLKYRTDSFTTFELQNPSHDVSELHNFRLILRLWNCGRVGRPGNKDLLPIVLSHQQFRSNRQLHNWSNRELIDLSRLENNTLNNMATFKQDIDLVYLSYGNELLFTRNDNANNKDLFRIKETQSVELEEKQYKLKAVISNGWSGKISTLADRPGLHLANKVLCVRLSVLVQLGLPHRLPTEGQHYVWLPLPSHERGMILTIVLSSSVGFIFQRNCKKLSAKENIGM